MNTKSILLITFLLGIKSCFAQNYFITTWETTQANESITIPTYGTGYNYDIDWNNDGVFDTIGVTGNANYNYPTPGLYTVAIRGEFPRIYFNNSGDKLKIKSIKKWGDIAWTSMENAFYGCNNLTVNSTDAPDLSNVTNMANMFKGAITFNQTINNWDVSNVTNMSGLFSGDFPTFSLFNQPIDNWNVSNVTNMSKMFLWCIDFNQPIGNWNVGNVTNMVEMFHGAQNFNQPIGGWDVSQVTLMYYMFQGAVDFNQPIGNWDVSNVIHMRSMFEYAVSFNQPIDNWDVSNVTSMLSMFDGAQNFNQPLTNWDVSNVTHFNWMFDNATSFNQPLENWDVSMAIQMQGMFNGAISFNQPIGDWDVSSVTNMSYMFKNTQSFNQNVENWDVSNVQQLQGMFQNASAFNQPIGNWDVSIVFNISNMFNGATLSTENYDNLLNGWTTLTLQNNLNFHGGNSNYCNGETARNNIINTFGWTITDNDLDCSDLSVDDFQTNVVEVFPNPSTDFIFIKNSPSHSFIIYNMNGQKVLSIKTDINTSLKKIDISALQTGVYFIKIDDTQKKIIIN